MRQREINLHIRFTLRKTNIRGNYVMEYSPVYLKLKANCRHNLCVGIRGSDEVNFPIYLCVDAGCALEWNRDRRCSVIFDR